MIRTVTPDAPRARATDPLTSHEAADATQDTVAASQAAVRSLLLTRGDLTHMEMVQLLACEFSPSRVRTACHELVEAGIVEAGGKVRPEGHRTRMTVWRLA